VAIYRDLVLWQRSVDLAVATYALTNALPLHDRFALADQMNRAAVSIPSNIAEGAARGTDREFIRYLLIARGSLAELDTQLQIALRLGYFSDSGDFDLALAEVGNLLNSFLRRLRAKIPGWS